MGTLDILQTIALCVISVALTVIAVSAFLVAIRFVSFLSPSELMDEIEDDAEVDTFMEEKAARRKRRKH